VLRKKIAQFKNEYPKRFDEIWHDRKRVALQTNENKDAEMILSDTNGQVRLRLSVTEQDNAMIQFFDQKGELVKQIKADN
jgi:phage regulator Rha-like protein